MAGHAAPRHRRRRRAPGEPLFSFASATDDKGHDDADAVEGKERLRALRLPPTADFHVHLRDGAMMEMVVPTIRQGGVDLVYVMVRAGPLLLLYYYPFFRFFSKFVFIFRRQYIVRTHERRFSSL